MKFRHVFVVLGCLALAAILITTSAVIRYQPKQYKFLGSNSPKKTVLEPDRIGRIGREARYYVIHKTAASVTADAESELSGVGWKRLHNDPALFGRGPHETIDVREASEYNDSQLLGGIPKSELSAYTVVKVVDPRIPAAIRSRFARWSGHKMHMLQKFVCGKHAAHAAVYTTGHSNPQSEEGRGDGANSVDAFSVTRN